MGVSSVLAGGGSDTGTDSAGVSAVATVASGASEVLGASVESLGAAGALGVAAAPLAGARSLIDAYEGWFGKYCASSMAVIRPSVVKLKISGL